MLWIAFDLYLWKIEHSRLLQKRMSELVVNCFRFVSLKDWTQLSCHRQITSPSCELLSICIFERLNTAGTTLIAANNLLWIAFDLYLWKIEHSTISCTKQPDIVVNCFRFVSLKDWTQLNKEKEQAAKSCELLSICIFERLNTAYCFAIIEKCGLWIAFDLYLWKIEHSWNIKQ